MNRYCEFTKLGAWDDAMKKADMSTAADFLDWVCDNHKITSEGTSWEYFRQYLQLYTDINGQYMDKNDCRAIKNVCRPLDPTSCRTLLTEVPIVPRYDNSGPLRPTEAQHQWKTGWKRRQLARPADLQHWVR